MTDKTTLDLSRWHVRFGWWSLLVFLSLGIVLEAFHGLKVRWYLDVANETRRLMWTLGHAHGTLLSVVHIAFGLTVGLWQEPRVRWFRVTSPSLVAASLLLPGGFLLGGVTIYSGDPGLGILLVPVGAALLFVAVFSAAWAATFPRRTRATGGQATAKADNV